MPEACATVKTTVATPFAFVVELAEANLPPTSPSIPPVFDHVITLPEVATSLSKASLN